MALPFTQMGGSSPTLPPAPSPADPQFLVDWGLLGEVWGPALVFSSLSPPLSLGHCKPIFKKVPIIRGWACWWKETDTPSLPGPETSSL